MMKILSFLYDHLWMIIVCTSAALSQSLPTHTVTILTVPEGCEIRASDSLLGSSPLTISLPSGAIVITASMSGYAPLTETLSVAGAERILHTMTMQRFPTLFVDSQPDNATVVLDSIILGRTPIGPVTTTAGLHSLRIQRDNFQTKEFTFEAVNGANRRFAPVLTPKFGFLSLMVSPPDAVIELDGNVLPSAPPERSIIRTGPHRVRITHPSIPHSIESDMIIGPGMHLTASGALDGFSSRAFSYSMLVPGLGQIIGGSFLKGAGQAGGMAAASLFLYRTFGRLRDSERHLDAMTIYYRSAPSEAEAIIWRGQMVHAADGVRKARDQRTIAIAAAAAVYLGTLIDALLFHSEITTLSLSSYEQISLIDGAYQFPEQHIRISIPLEVPTP